VHGVPTGQSSRPAGAALPNAPYGFPGPGARAEMGVLGPEVDVLISASQSRGDNRRGT
jgi:hypothetical protein